MSTGISTSEDQTTTASNRLDYGIIDCDTHCYEPRDAFLRYLPEEYRDRAVGLITEPGGDEVIVADGRVARFNSDVLRAEPGMCFERAHLPGSLKEMLKAMSTGNPAETYEAVPMRPEWTDRDARVKRMEQQGVDKAVIFPAELALSLEHYTADTGALYANARSFNQWYNEAWGFNYQDKIYAPALLSLRDLDSAVAETERVINEGARFVLLPTGPAYGRSPGDPYFDPVWARLEEAGVRIALHIMPFWYFDAMSTAWGHDPDPGALHMSAWQWQNVYGQRPIEDTLSALIFDNLFGRFPKLMVLAAEFGAEWVPGFVRHMDKSRGMGRNGPWKGGQLTSRPSKIFREHVRVVPYPEDDIPAIVERLGSADCLVMGSDYPHPEGVAEPIEFAGLTQALGADAQKKILRTNAEVLFASPS